MEMAIGTVENRDNEFGFNEIAVNCNSNLRGIYMIKCKENNKIYIGQGIDIKRRFFDHRRGLRKGTHINSIMQHAYNKYGEDAFTLHILERVDDVAKLYDREAYWCKYFDTFNRDKGFNICPITKDEFDRDDFARKVMGSNNGKARLTEKEVVEICLKINEGELSAAKIGALYDVKRETIKDIRKGRTWRQISIGCLSDDVMSNWK